MVRTSRAGIVAALLTLSLIAFADRAAIASPDGNPRQQIRMNRVEQITPNPYDPTKGSTEISVVIARPAQVELRIYAMDGTHVADVANEALGAGPHRFSWDGRGGDGTAVSTGSYICQLRVGEFVSSEIIIVIR